MRDAEMLRVWSRRERDGDGERERLAALGLGVNGERGPATGLSGKRETVVDESAG